MGLVMVACSERRTSPESGAPPAKNDATLAQPDATPAQRDATSAQTLILDAAPDPALELTVYDTRLQCRGKNVRQVVAQVHRRGAICMPL